MQKYKMTTEEESSLFDRRIKLLELIILTVTAIIALMSFTKLYNLVWPILALGIDTIFLVLVIIFCANKKGLETTFIENVEATKIEISYKLQWLDIVAFIIYIFAIVLFGVFFSYYIS